MLELSYKNSRGTVILCGHSSPFHITNAVGLGLPQAEYTAASYFGYDGQETLSSSYLPRCITLSGDLVSDNTPRELAKAIDILSVPGYLYIKSSDINRRIYCNQITFPDAERILKGKICTFAIQFVCDNPFFESAQTVSVALYRRTKELASPFTLPCLFGVTVAEGTLRPEASIPIEPEIRILSSLSTEAEASVIITNHSTNKKIRLLHQLTANEEIVINIKNRTITSSAAGNIISSISDDTFLGDFRLEPLDNHITVSISDVSRGIVVECIYNDSFIEALVV